MRFSSQWKRAAWWQAAQQRPFGRRVEVAWALALLFTALAVLFQEPLTRSYITLDPGQSDHRFHSYAYGDEGGRATAKALGPMRWSCNLPVASSNAFCGFGLLLDADNLGRGVDLERHHAMHVSLRYDGRAEFLRIILKNHTPALGRVGDTKATKFQQGTIAVTSGNQAARARISDFVVADWWKEMSGLHPDLTRPDFTNVTAVEFVTTTSSAPGEHVVSIDSVRFERRIVSTETFYGSIAACWILLVSFVLVRRRQTVEQWKRRLSYTALNSVPEVIWSAGPNGLPDFVSDQWTALYGGAPSAVTGRAWTRRVHRADLRPMIQAWRSASSAGESFERECRVRLADGSYRWCLARARPAKGDDGGIARWFGTLTDTHDRVAAVGALEASERLHRGILEASADSISILAADGTIEFINGPGVTANELDSAKEVAGLPWKTLWQPKAWPLVESSMGRARKGETVRFHSFRPTRKGTPKWWDVVLTPMLDDADAVQGMLAVARDVTSHREKSEQLRWASEHDALTALPNRRAFQSRLEAASLRAMITGEQLGLLVVDLDHFKHINDSLGHSAGDEVLEVVSGRLKGAVRETDFVARVGGDEFAVILENIRSKEHLLELGQKIFREVRAPIPLARRAISAGASIGGALFPADADSANDLFKHADTALYALKGSGRGGTMLFDGYMLKGVEKAASQLNRARNALSEKSVLPVYQPKVDVQTGRIAGFEALLRWRHPMKGLQLPGTVEEAFKDYELATKIGELMQRRVAQDIRSWMDRGLAFGRVSLNAAPAEFLRGDYAERLLAVLEEQRVAPQMIEVEVTEHALLEQGPEFVARALAQLKAAGVLVSLDDFGTGYSSLSHLRDYPVDLVKIDMSFIQRMSEDPEIAAIVSAVVSLARSIAIDVVAEGVETTQQHDLLKVMGCQFAQGHLFGKAVEEQQVAALLGLSQAA